MVPLLAARPIASTADFRRFGHPQTLPINHLLCENRRTQGRMGEVGLGWASALLLVAASCAAQSPPVHGVKTQPQCWDDYMAELGSRFAPPASCSVETLA